MASIPWQAGGSISSLLEILGIDEVPTVYKGNLTLESVDQNSLDSALAQYSDDPEAYHLRPLRLSKRKSVISQAEKFVSERYPQNLQLMYLALMIAALINGQANRIAYIGELLNWVKQVSQKSIEAEIAIGAAATAAEIKAVQIDLAALAASDPQTTIKTAIQIED